MASFGAGRSFRTHSVLCWRGDRACAGGRLQGSGSRRVHAMHVWSVPHPASAGRIDKMTVRATEQGDEADKALGSSGLVRSATLCVRRPISVATPLCSLSSVLRAAGTVPPIPEVSHTAKTLLMCGG